MINHIADLTYLPCRPGTAGSILYGRVNFRIERPALPL